MMYPSREFEDAVSALCHGTATEEQVQELAALLRTDASARDAYLLAVELHARLASDNGLFAEQSRPACRDQPEPIAERPRADVAGLRAGGRWRRVPGWYFAAGTAAVLVLVALAIWRSSDFEIRTQTPASVAVRVLEAEGAVPGAWQPGQSLSFSHLRLQAGHLRLRIEESGVILSVSGPAEMQLPNPLLARLTQGQVTADVGEQGQGFSVETSQGRFVDRGTTFGVDASAAGTDLVVFKGRVQVYRDTRDAPPLSPLAEGEAVRVRDDRSLARIPNIVSGPGRGPWSTQPPAPERCVIAAVRDNLRSPHDRVFYQIIPGGFRENTQAYVGPRHVWKGRTATGLPPYLLGADMVRTFPTDQDRKGLQITVQLSRPAMLYVLFETRPQQWQWREAGNIPEVPAWLEKNFHKIGDAVGLDDAGQLQPGEAMSLQPGDGHLVTFDVWERKFSEPGEVTLGPPTGPEGWKNWMYGVLAKPLDTRANGTAQTP